MKKLLVSIAFIAFFSGLGMAKYVESSSITDHCYMEDGVCTEHTWSQGQC